MITKEDMKDLAMNKYQRDKEHQRLWEERNLPNHIDKFRKGQSTFKCQSCGKLTRQTEKNNANQYYCADCIRETEQENEEIDNWDGD